jgi:hypothetical protein
MMGVVKNRHGTYNAQKKVPERLQEALASVLGTSKRRQKWLKKSLGTKDQREAHIRAKPVLMSFDRLLADAAALMKKRPLQTTLASSFLVGQPLNSLPGGLPQIWSDPNWRLIQPTTISPSPRQD